LDGAAKTRFETYIANGDYRELAGLLVFGEPSRFSAFSYEGWFRELTSYGNGLWLGDGINSQTTLKLSKIISSAAASPAKGFAWFVNKGQSRLIKYVTAKDDDFEEGFWL
jgi:hypothetical protein